MSRGPKRLRGVEHPIRTLEEALRERGATDFRGGITECPFTSKRMTTGWLLGWVAQRTTELEDA